MNQSVKRIIQIDGFRFTFFAVLNITFEFQKIIIIIKLVIDSSNMSHQPPQSSAHQPTLSCLVDVHMTNE